MLLEWKGFKSVTSTCEEICAVAFPYWAEQLGPQSRYLLLCRIPLLCLKTSMGLDTRTQSGGCGTMEIRTFGSAKIRASC